MVPVRFEMITEQKRDETKPTRPLTASESSFWSKRFATGTHLLYFVFNDPCVAQAPVRSCETSVD